MDPCLVSENLDVQPGESSEVRQPLSIHFRYLIHIQVPAARKDVMCIGIYRFYSLSIVKNVFAV